MEQVKSASYQEVLDRLLACGPVRTWSLIVTILGDLAAEGNARVPGPVLTQLTEPMGMKPEALRVAIHRLRRDGWIASERDGRTSLYGMTAHGREVTLAAMERVYGERAPAPGSWRVVVAQSAEAMQALDFPELIPIGPKTGLLPDGEGALPDTVLAWAAKPGTVPDWVKAILVPGDLAQAYEILAEGLAEALALPVPEAAIERAVLRLMALHQWRRLVLRHGAAVEALMGPDWAGAICRKRVTALMQKLGRPAPEALLGEGAQRMG